MIITEIQKKLSSLFRSIQKLWLLMADMYRRGLITGAVWLAIGVGCGFVITGLKEIYKYQKSKKENEEES